MKPALTLGILGTIVAVAVVFVAWDMRSISSQERPTEPAVLLPAKQITLETGAGKNILHTTPETLEQRKAAQLRVSDFQTRWNDAFRLAESTPRVNLAGPVKDLQALAREAADLDLSPCLEPGRGPLVQSLNAKIDYFLAFMQQDHLRRSDLLDTAAREERNWKMVVDACRH